MIADVAVVGGGVIGSSIAYHVQRAGGSCALIDPAPFPQAPAATWASAGGVRSQRRDQREWALTVRSAERWPGLADELGADLGFARGGHLHVVDNPDAAADLASRIDRERQAGINVEYIDGDALRELAPGIAADALGASYTPGDGQADPQRTGAAFRAAAVRGGVADYRARAASLLVKGGAVAGVETTSGTVEAGTVVLAAGSWTAGLLERWGIRLPLIPRIAQIILTEAADDALTPTITWHGRKLSLKQTPAGNYLIGGGWEGTYSPERHSYRLDRRSVESSLTTARGAWPRLAGLGTAAVWCGLESESPDGVPYLGAVDALGGPAGLHVAVGFSGHGFQISPAVGEAMALLLAGGNTGDLIVGLRPARAAAEGKAASDGTPDRERAWQNAG